MNCPRAEISIEGLTSRARIRAMASTPFDNLDSAHEYLRLLAIQVSEVSDEIQLDITAAGAEADARQLDALRLVAFKLQQLDRHVRSSRGILNDLRMLRRVLVGGTRLSANGDESGTKKEPVVNLTTGS